MPQSAPLRRPSSGYAAWRLIAEELRTEISTGRLAVGEQIPGEMALAERFGVNRHTARQAVGALADEGLLASQQGLGTFVAEHPTHLHRVGLRTRLSRSIPDDPAEGELTTGLGRTEVLSAAEIEAPPEIATRLGLRPEGARALMVETARALDGAPLAVSTRWFDAERLPGIVDALRTNGSVTAALRECGIDDYLRTSTVIGARHATAAEAETLGILPGAVVLVSEALDALPDGTPLQSLVTRFNAQRVKLDIEHTSTERRPR